jgi:Rrf2 family nitric oxide-sensitive transcriptional repressor
MKLTSFTDYALRLLLMAQAAGGALITIEDAARRYRISRTHLMKVANQLTRAGFLEAVRGRGGGLKLGRPAEKIRIGDVVRATEPDFALVECFGSGNECTLTGFCRLPPVLRRASAAFLAELDKATLADMAIPSSVRISGSSP